MEEATAEAFTGAIQRMRAEYLEMPGLTLTVAQAARLWTLDTTLCQSALAALVEAGFLVRMRHSAFARAE